MLKSSYLDVNNTVKVVLQDKNKPNFACVTVVVYTTIVPLHWLQTI